MISDKPTPDLSNEAVFDLRPRITGTPGALRAALSGNRQPDSGFTSQASEPARDDTLFAVFGDAGVRCLASALVRHWRRSLREPVTVRPPQRNSASRSLSVSMWS